MKRNSLILLAVVAATSAGAMVWGRGGSIVVGEQTTPAESLVELKAMQAALVAPETAVTLEMLRALVHLEVRVHPATEPQSIGFSGGISVDALPVYQAAYRKYGGELARALEVKQEQTRGTCVVTLLKMPGKLAAADGAKVTPWVAGMLPGMTKEEVTSVLKHRWLLARSPGLLPVLLKMYDALPDEQVSAGKYGASEERDALLWRAYELSPSEVRGRVLAAIKDPGHRFSELWMTSLLGLPDKELPEMDEAFAAMIQGPARGAGSVPSWIWSKLVARYGTEKLKGDLKAYYETAAGRWACTLQESMLAYFLRVDPAYGKEAFVQSLASRQTGCWRMSFGNVTTLIWTNELEQLALGALADPEAEVAIAAAGALKRKGSPAAKEALLTALGKPYRANPQTATPALDQPEATRRRAIVRALLDGHAWVLTPAEVAGVQAMAVDPELADLCKTWAAQTTVTISLDVDGSGKPSLRLGNELYDTLAEFESKVGLFPAGMKYKVRSEESDELRREFMVWAQEKKLTVE